MIADGSNTQVSCNNVHEYVRKYAEYQMVKHCDKCLQVATLSTSSKSNPLSLFPQSSRRDLLNLFPQQMKSGVHDVLPKGALDTLTPEDFRLLLNGVGDIDVETLISYTSFNDESG